jgi:hypothetical protein
MHTASKKKKYIIFIAILSPTVFAENANLDNVAAMTAVTKTTVAAITPIIIYPIGL